MIRKFEYVIHSGLVRRTIGSGSLGDQLWTVNAHRSNRCSKLRVMVRILPANATEVPAHGLALARAMSHCRRCPAGWANGPRDRRRSQSRPLFKVRVAPLGPLRTSNVSPTLPSSQPSAGTASAKNSHIRSRLESNAHMILYCPSDGSGPRRVQDHCDSPTSWRPSEGAPGSAVTVRHRESTRSSHRDTSRGRSAGLGPLRPNRPALADSVEELFHQTG